MAVETFEVGKWYICTCKERPRYFNQRGEMDFLLDGKPHQYLGKGKMSGGGGSWTLHTEDFVEVVPLREKYKDIIRIKEE